MICGVAGLDCDECAATGGANFAMRDQFRFDDDAVVLRLDDLCDELHFVVGRRRAQEFDRVVGCDGAGRGSETVALHQVIGSRPV